MGSIQTATRSWRVITALLRSWQENPTHPLKPRQLPQCKTNPMLHQLKLRQLPQCKTNPMLHQLKLRQLLQYTERKKALTSLLCSMRALHGTTATQLMLLSGRQLKPKQERLNISGLTATTRRRCKHYKTRCKPSRLSYKKQAVLAKVSLDPRAQPGVPKR